MRIFLIILFQISLNFIGYSQVDTNKILTIGLENTYLFSENGGFFEMTKSKHSVKLNVCLIRGDLLISRNESKQNSYGIGIGYKYKLKEKINYPYLLLEYKYRYVYLDSIIWTIEQETTYAYEYKSPSQNIGLLYGKNWLFNNINLAIQMGAYLRYDETSKTNFVDIEQNEGVVHYRENRYTKGFSVIPSIEFQIGYKIGIK